MAREAGAAAAVVRQLELVETLRTSAMASWIPGAAERAMMEGGRVIFEEPKLGGAARAAEMAFARVNETPRSQRLMVDHSTWRRLGVGAAPSSRCRQDSH